MAPVSALPLVIYEYVKSPYDDWHQKAWGAALLLVLFVLSLNLLIGTRKNGNYFLSGEKHYSVIYSFSIVIECLF